MPQKRRLIHKPVLDEMTKMYSQGIPITKIMRKFRINNHHRVISNLVKYNLDKSVIVQRSLFPEFMSELPEHITVVAPDGWFYAGHWPKGVWLHGDWSLQQQQHAIEQSLSCTNTNDS